MITVEHKNKHHTIWIYNAGYIEIDDIEIGNWKETLDAESEKKQENEK